MITMPYAFKIVISCCIITIIGLGIPINCGGLFLGPVARDLSLGMGELTFYLTIQYLVIACCLSPAGKLMSGRHGKLILNIAVISYSVAFAALGLANGLWAFYIVAVLMGLGGTILVYLATPILITNWFYSGVGMAMGLALSAGGITSAICSPLISLLISNYGWRMAYAVCGFSMLIIALPFTLFIVQIKPGDIGLLPWGNPKHNLEKPGNGETVKRGLTLTHALRTISFYLIFLFVGLLGINSALIMHIPPHILEQGISSLAAASVLSALVIGVTCGMLSIGFLSDKAGAALGAVMGVLTGLAGIYIIYKTQNYYLLICGGFCYGFGASTTLISPPLIVKKIFGLAQYEQIFAAITVCSAIGAAMGASLFGFIKDSTGFYSYSMLAGAIIQFLALIFLVCGMLSGKKLQKRWE